MFYTLKNHNNTVVFSSNNDKLERFVDQLNDDLGRDINLVFAQKCDDQKGAETQCEINIDDLDESDFGLNK